MGVTVVALSPSKPPSNMTGGSGPTGAITGSDIEDVIIRRTDGKELLNQGIESGVGEAKNRRVCGGLTTLIKI